MCQTRGKQAKDYDDKTYGINSLFRESKDLYKTTLDVWREEIYCKVMCILCFFRDLNQTKHPQTYLHQIPECHLCLHRDQHILPVYLSLCAFPK